MQRRAEPAQGAAAAGAAAAGVADGGAPAAPALTAFAELIKDEVNVKDLVLSDSPASLGTVQLSVNPRVLGPRLGKQVQEVIRAVKAGDWSTAPVPVLTVAPL